MKANSRDIALGFDKIDNEVLPYFKDTAKDILEHHSPEDALARALAMITGYTEKMK